LAWSPDTGRPLTQAIVWQDRRAEPLCAELSEHAQRFAAETGLVLDPYFSAPKLAWLRRNVETDGVVTTSDTWLLRQLTGAFVTDATTASRSLVLGLGAEHWNRELLALFGLEDERMPDIVANDVVIGSTSAFGGEVPVGGIVVDQQAALLGQACLDAGMAKCTFGTGAFLLMNVGPEPKFSTRGLLATVGWTMETDAAARPIAYALEGSAFIAGALVQWLRDGLGLIAKAADIEPLARSVPDSGGVTIVPALTGLGAPHWRSDARGLITGLTRGTTKAHIARAALEAIALQNVDLVTAMQADAGIAINHLRVDGGAAANDLLMQIEADLLGVQIFRPEMVESTALGAAKLAALGIGLPPVEKGGETARMRMFTPSMTAERRGEMLAAWTAAVARA
jgi:glycerol kinase